MRPEGLSDGSGRGPQAWPGWGSAQDAAGSSSWAYNRRSTAQAAPPVTINSFITSPCPLTPFNAFTGIILGTYPARDLSLPLDHLYTETLKLPCHSIVYSMSIKTSGLRLLPHSATKPCPFVTELVVSVKFIPLRDTALRSNQECAFDLV